MAVDLRELVTPEHTAVVTSEVQRGVIDEQSVLPELAAAAAPTIADMGRLLKGARTAGVSVVHCLATRRADGRGSNRNARLFGALRGGGLTPEVVPALGPEPEDIQLVRYHGLSPMGNTDLDPVLRNLGVTTIVAVGVSVNIAITNLTFDAVNAGYQVVIPCDAVAGLPAEYVDAVFANTLSLVATVTTVDDLLALWS
jgi:nicotinamidase-related amidase